MDSIFTLGRFTFRESSSSDSDLDTIRGISSDDELRIEYDEESPDILELTAMFGRLSLNDIEPLQTLEQTEVVEEGHCLIEIPPEPPIENPPQQQDVSDENVMENPEEPAEVVEEGHCFSEIPQEAPMGNPPQQDVSAENVMENPQEPEGLVEECQYFLQLLEEEHRRLLKLGDLADSYESDLESRKSSWEYALENLRLFSGYPQDPDEVVEEGHCPSKIPQEAPMENPPQEDVSAEDVMENPEEPAEVVEEDHCLIKIPQEAPIENPLQQDESAEDVMENPQEPAEVVKEGKYFLQILGDEQRRLLKLADLADSYASDLETRKSSWDNALENLRLFSGSARLLVSSKMKQLEQLCHNNISPSPDNQYPVTGEDLHGFWDMVYQQVPPLNNLFGRIEEMKANNWEELAKPDTNIKELSGSEKSAKSRKKKWRI